jgi:hypothetical protein
MAELANATPGPTETPPATNTPETATPSAAPPDPAAPAAPAPDKSPAEGTLLAEAEGEKAPATPFDAKALVIPEGVQLRDADIEALTPLAAKHGLSTEAVNDLLGVHAEALKAAAIQPYQAWVDQNKAWVEEIKKDPELGDGNGLKTEVKTAAAKVIADYGGQPLKDALNATGAGNHPAMIRFVNKIAKVLTEATHVQGRPASRATGPGPEAMYGVEGPRATPALKAG